MTFDAIVLGGGPAGATTAYLLAAANWNVALVEKCVYPRRKVCGEFMSATNLPLLAAMGLAEVWRDAGGPPVKRVGLFARGESLSAPMPGEARNEGVGRAFSRATLDSLILEAAREKGAQVWQPWRAVSLRSTPDRHECAIENGNQLQEISAPVLIAAHGSWEPGKLPTQLAVEKSDADLLAFKFLFQGSTLDADLMPLVAFPGGYGGMAHTSCGWVGLSCCVRRDVLQDRRAFYGSATAADAVLRHICDTTGAAQRVIVSATEVGSRLAAGPIRPGIRTRYKEGIFRAGNAAGEAHPIIAEGISMAIQSGGWVADALVSHCSGGLNRARIDEAGRDYSRRWSAQFSTRIRAAHAFSNLAMSEGGRSLMIHAVRSIPALLTIGAALSGKAKECTWASTGRSAETNLRSAPVP